MVCRSSTSAHVSGAALNSSLNMYIRIANEYLNMCTFPAEQHIFATCHYKCG